MAPAAMSLLLVPVIVTVLCWLLSLRRTPWAGLWLAFAAGMAGVGMLIVAGVEDTHHTVPGLIAGMLTACTLPLLAAGCTEELATSRIRDAAIRAWRAEHPRRRVGHAEGWRVTTVPWDDGVSVNVWVGRPGAKSRLIGRADPLADMDAFMELRVKADQAAETLNALRIGG